MKAFVSLLCAALCALAADVSVPAYPLVSDSSVDAPGLAINDTTDHQAVKNPYVSAWLAGNQSNNVPAAQPFFWQGQSLLWQVLARVDNQTYTLFGCPDGVTGAKAAKQTAISYTSTHTLVQLQAGNAAITLDFFSPVSLTDYTRQSIPLSYLTVSSDGSAVDIFSAVDDSWTAQQGNVQAGLQKAGDALLFTLNGTNSVTFSEKQQMATWGHFIFATSAHNGAATYQIGAADDVHATFASAGALSGQQAAYKTGYLVALADKLDASSKSTTFAIGLHQAHAINFLGDSYAGYFEAQYGTAAAVTEHFLADYPAALTESSTLDKRIVSIGSAVSSQYSDILEAHVRQIFGGFQVTIPSASLDTTQAKAFIKEISTDGNVNTVADLIPRTIPFFYLLAPEYIRMLLDPILIFSKQWPADFAVHDIGKHYPNATGETVQGEEPLLLDQTSVLLWMVYAYQKASKDTDWVQPYVPILQKYADYLVTNGLYPPKQRSAVDSITATANQTVLAIYSAIRLTSFGTLTGKTNYTDKGHEYAAKTLQMGINPAGNHIMAHYNDPGTSWISAYPFAFDKMLGLGTFNESIYDLQSKWYATQEHPYGVQFYSGVNKTVSTLEMWLAATSASDVRDFLIGSIHKCLTSGLNSIPGPTIWNVVGDNIGVAMMTKAKSDVGSYFMLAAVQGDTA